MTEPTGAESRRIVGYRNYESCAAAPMVVGATDFSNWVPIYADEADEAGTPPVSMDEVEALKHDVDRARATANELVTENVKLRKVLTECRDRLGDCIGAVLAPMPIHNPNTQDKAFDLLEGLKEAWRVVSPEKAQAISSGFARGTGGIDVDWLIELLGPSQ